jgi:hypothetical protein
MVSWSPGGVWAFVRVYELSGALRYTSFDPEQLEFDSDDWHGIARGQWLLPADAALERGDYQLWLCAVETLRRDDATQATTQHALDSDAIEGRLGWLSGAVVGRCQSRDLHIR